MTDHQDIDFCVSREMILQRFEGQPGPCPRCGAPLYQHNQVYMIATRRGRRIADSFMLSGDFGWYCAQCPTVVINADEVSEMLSFSLPRWDVGDEFAVLGLVDLDAVPDDKKDVPLGEDDNLIPLIEFSYAPAGLATRPARKRRSRTKRSRPPRQKKKKKKKRRR